jgi:hypothetical protein
VKFAETVDQLLNRKAGAAETDTGVGGADKVAEGRGAGDTGGQES